ncbi:MAG: HEPN domain-containing protein [Chloroflexi bacterium]|nr:HEPN domain-containing protein [Chloroflexota bacterium]
MSAHPVAEWIEKAEGNYNSAQILMRQRKQSVPDVVCNQCQQCAEKYLKALLVRHGLGFPKTHDLTQLKNLIKSIDADVMLIAPALDVLNPYGIDVRYPGLQATAKDARDAVNAMKTVRKFARAKLGLKP